MASKVREIGKPNFIAIAGMEGGDILKVREYYIVCLVTARRTNDSDTMENCIDWIIALTAEMRLRGGSRTANPLAAAAGEGRLIV